MTPKSVRVALTRTQICHRLGIVYTQYHVLNRLIRRERELREEFYNLSHDQVEERLTTMETEIQQSFPGDWCRMKRRYAELVGGEGVAIIR